MKKLVFISTTCFSLFLILIGFSSFSWAVYTGDETYTDRNATIFSAYESINNDLINRIANASSQSVGITTLLNRLKNPAYNFYIYYGDNNGSSLINGSTWKTDNLYIAFFSSSEPSTSVSQYNNYQGIDTDIRLVSNISLYQFNGNTLSPASAPSSVYIPTILMTYKSATLIEFINNNSASQNQAITQALQEQTNTIQEQTATIEEQTQTIQQSTNTINDSLTSTEYDESGVSIDTSATDSIDTSSTYNLFSTIFTNFGNLINNNNWNNVETIRIGLPYVDESNYIELRSDIVSSKLQGTLIYTIIITAWYSAFGLYIFKFVTKLFNAIKSGNILSGFSFDDEVITSSMM